MTKFCILWFCANWVLIIKWTMFQMCLNVTRRMVCGIYFVFVNLLNNFLWENRPAKGCWNSFEAWNYWKIVRRNHRFWRGLDHFFFSLKREPTFQEFNDFLWIAMKISFFRSILHYWSKYGNELTLISCRNGFKVMRMDIWTRRAT